MPPPDGVIAHGDGHRPLLPHQHDQLFGPRDRRVEQVALQHHEMGRQHRHDHGPILAALALVDADGVGVDQFIQVRQVIGHRPALEPHGQRLLHPVQGRDAAHVAVEHLPVIVVADLHHPVAQAEQPPAPAVLRLARRRRVEGRLQAPVQLPHPGGPPVEGRKDLHLGQRVEAEFAGDAVLDDVHDQVGGPFGVLGGKEEKVGRLPGKKGHLPPVDAVGVGDDVAPRRLAKDLGQAHHGYRPRFDDVLQDVARTDAGQLIHIAHQQQVACRVDRFEQVVGQDQVQHGGFVHDDHIHFQGVLLVAPEAHPFLGLEFEQPVDGPGLAARRLGQTLGRPAGGRGQGVAQAFGFQEADDGPHRRRLARARPAGEDGDLVAQGGPHRRPLALVEPGAVRRPRQEAVQVGPAEKGQAALWDVEQGLQPPGDAGFAVVKGRQVDGPLLAQHHFAPDPVLGGAILDADLLLLGQAFDALGHQVGRHVQDAGALVDQFALGRIDVALVGHLVEGVGDAGLHPLRAIVGQAQLAGDLVGGEKADAVDVAGQAVGVAAHYVNGRVAVGFIDFDGVGGADVVAL